MQSVYFVLVAPTSISPYHSRYHLSSLPCISNNIRLFLSPDVRHSYRQSEISAKLEPAHPGGALSQLLKGELGAAYEPAIGVLWEGTEGELPPPPRNLTGFARFGQEFTRLSKSTCLIRFEVVKGHVFDWLVG